MKKVLFYPIKLDRPGFSISIIHRALAERLNRKFSIIAFKESQKTRVGDVKLYLSFKNRFLDALYVNLIFIFNISNIDIVHMVPNIALLPLFLLGKLFRRKIVYTFHEAPDLTQKRPFWEREILLFFGRRADRLTCVSDYAKASVVRNLRKSPVRIYNGIEKGFVWKRNLSWVRREFKIKNKNPCILYVGALREGKGADVFIRLAKKFPDVNFILVGKGELYNDLKYFIDYEKNLFYKSFVEHDKLKVLYSSCSALLFPSTVDAFGLVCIEAISCGTPVIAFNAGASPEIATKNTGILCNNEGEFEIALKKILSKEFKFSSKEAKTIMNKFNWDKIALEYLRVYEKD